MADIELHNTSDPMVWAEEWCRIARQIELESGGSILSNDPEGWMVGWFANAMEAGRRAGLVKGQIRSEVRPE